MSQSVFPGPIAPENNPPINANYYQPSRFEIADISLGATTVVTTTDFHNYVVAQLVRLLVPESYGTFQLNEQIAYVISVPSTISVELDIDSSFFNSYVSSPFIATITNASQAPMCVVTANNSFVPGSLVTIEDVEGMTQLNQTNLFIDSANATSFTLNLDSSAYSVYTMGGTATLQKAGIFAFTPQIMAVGDIGNGVSNTGRTNNITYIPGSFINISPQ